MSNPYLEKSEDAADNFLERSFLKDSFMLEGGAEGEARLEETEALFRMAKETFLCASASLGLSVVERRTGALICGLLLQPRFMSSSDLRRSDSELSRVFRILN